jgi:PKD repeat protein
LDQPGNYDVTLIVTDGGLSDTIIKTVTINGVIVQSLPIAEGFESGNSTLIGYSLNGVLMNQSVDMA